MPELMKGNVWLKRCDAVDRKGNPVVAYPVDVETKHDEIRCHVIVDPKTTRVQFLSYAGKPLHNMQGFAAQFYELYTIAGHTEFDCGFEVNGNFNDSYRWVRSSSGLPTDLVGVSVMFYLYDLPEVKLVWSARKQTRNNACKCVPWLLAPACVTAWNAEMVLGIFNARVAEGYEGVMVKQLGHMYERGKRTDGWLKFKPEETTDGCIVGFIEATATVVDPANGISVGDGLGRVGSILVRCEDGSTAAPHGIPHELGRRMWLNQSEYLGQWLEFKYMERDRQGGYRHPVFKRFREAKQ